MKESNLKIKINEQDHIVLAWYCKFKGTSIKKYITKKLNSDPELIKFKDKVKELVFK